MSLTESLIAYFISKGFSQAVAEAEALRLIGKAMERVQ